ncbi:hypothetical protein DIPPA_16692 [Diplonema papillatum]|nr:hypothetical protein DIPPA_16692 [Diplonema papillatum]
MPLYSPACASPLTKRKVEVVGKVGQFHRWNDAGDDDGRGAMLGGLGEAGERFKRDQQRRLAHAVDAFDSPQYFPPARASAPHNQTSPTTFATPPMQPVAPPSLRAFNPDIVTAKYLSPVQASQPSFTPWNAAGSPTFNTNVPGYPPPPVTHALYPPQDNPYANQDAPWAAQPQAIYHSDVLSQRRARASPVAVAERPWQSAGPISLRQQQQQQQQHQQPQEAAGQEGDFFHRLGFGTGEDERRSRLASQREAYKRDLDRQMREHEAAKGSGLPSFDEPPAEVRFTAGRRERPSRGEAVSFSRVRGALFAPADVEKLKAKEDATRQLQMDLERQIAERKARKEEEERRRKREDEEWEAKYGRSAYEAAARGTADTKRAEQQTVKETAADALKDPRFAPLKKVYHHMKYAHDPPATVKPQPAASVDHFDDVRVGASSGAAAQPRKLATMPVPPEPAGDETAQLQQQRPLPPLPSFARSPPPVSRPTAAPTLFRAATPDTGELAKFPRLLPFDPASGPGGGAPPLNFQAMPLSFHDEGIDQQEEQLARLEEKQYADLMSATSLRPAPGRARGPASSEAAGIQALAERNKTRLRQLNKLSSHMEAGGDDTQLVDRLFSETKADGRPTPQWMLELQENVRGGADVDRAFRQPEEAAGTFGDLGNATLPSKIEWVRCEAQAAADAAQTPPSPRATPPPHHHHHHHPRKLTLGVSPADADVQPLFRSGDGPVAAKPKPPTPPEHTPPAAAAAAAPPPDPPWLEEAAASTVREKPVPVPALMFEPAVPAELRPVLSEAMLSHRSDNMSVARTADLSSHVLQSIFPKGTQVDYQNLIGTVNSYRDMVLILTIEQTGEVVEALPHQITVVNPQKNVEFDGPALALTQQYSQLFSGPPSAPGTARGTVSAAPFAAAMTDPTPPPSVPANPKPIRPLVNDDSAADLLRFQTNTDGLVSPTSTHYHEKRFDGEASAF